MMRGLQDQTVPSYTIDILCPECGKRHPVSGNFQLVDGPTEAGSLADLYNGRALPARLVGLLRDRVRCDKAGEWVRSLVY